MSPLEEIIRGLIAANGPMRLDRYMELCLGHPKHGYYMSRDPIGARGDFITAPEISQAFGELVGVWCIGAWAAMGKPKTFQLVELGPGRGTLMSDILRTVRKSAAEFAAGASVHLVETSPVLGLLQKEILGGVATWHDDFSAVPEGPMLLVANEFFDAIPIRQFEKRQGRWYERVMGVADDRLQLGLAPAGLGPVGADGDISESAPARNDIAQRIGRRLTAAPGAALIIDYGHVRSAPGDTLQAMRRHGYAPITEDPGECDLTSHVDFEALARALHSGGAVVPAAITQGDFLRAMGLEQRMAYLMSKVEEKQRPALQRQMRRLAEPDQMGNLFKVLAAVSPGMAIPYPFGQA